jgi:acid phosphatase (class A)
MKNPRFHSAARGVGLVLAGVVAGAACAMADDALPVPEIRPGVLAGYLPRTQVPDSVALLPPPPAEGSAALAMDEEISRTDLALQGAPRWKLAGMDANLSFPWAAGDFACSLNAPVTQQDTPRLYQMLRRAMTDAGSSTHAAKDNYKRKRPFMVNNAPTCTPGAEDGLRQDGSYPSGHTAIGWTWALILSEISPEQGDAILARGRTFAQSRVVCNVHWQSDTIESLELAAGTVARLHGDPVFLADLAAAKSELAAVRARKLPPQRDCKAEADALAQQPPQAP